jgi:hypothetical protein
MKRASYQIATKRELHPTLRWLAESADPDRSRIGLVEHSINFITAVVSLIAALIGLWAGIRKR